MEANLVSGEVHSIILYGILSVLSFLVATVMFFVKKLLSKIELMWDKLLIIEVTIKNFQDDVAYVKNVKSDFRERFEDLIILKRDQTSIWKKLDTLQSKMGLSQ
jgi:hypothetical protein